MESPISADGLVQLVCATRASALAMWQTRHAMARLAAAGMVSTVLPISTKGDQILDRSLAELGTDSIFVKELEFALRERRADYAVHSCKDLPSALPGDMLLAAIGTREDPRDVFCSERFAAFAELPSGARIGTSSPRRRAQLGALRPDLRYDSIRGNIDTRLRKLADGEFDAIVLAAAGLARLGLSARYTQPFEANVVVPAVGQGALAIELRSNETKLAARIHKAFADPPSELAIYAERACLRALRSGCQSPVGIHARFDGAQLDVCGAVAAPNGSKIVREVVRGPVADNTAAEALGTTLARQLLAAGGDALLDPNRGTPGPARS